jgi:hypothetical protein
MSKADELERAVRDLPPEDLRQFRDWFREFDSELWERQLGRDIAAGRLDGLVDEARTEHREGRTRPL